MARGARAQTLTVEALPEADRLGAFPHPRHTLRLFGHDGAQTELRAALDSGRMHHAWMLTGRSGIGKATLAYAVARRILAGPDERLDEPGRPFAVRADCSAERQVGVLSHPGLLLIRRPWDQKAKRHLTQIPVDEVRRLKTFVSLSAGGGDRRVVIADSLDEMNVNAANALLKALEEPPTGLVFLLIASEPGRVLPTIRSRCRTLALRPLSDDLVVRAARAAAAACDGIDLPEGTAATTLAALAEGSVGRYLTLAAADGVKLQARVRALFDRLPAVDWTAVHALADETSGADKAERFDLLWELLLTALSGSIRARVQASQATERAAACRMIAEDRVSQAAVLWADAVAEKAELDSLNLDRRILLVTLVQRLARLAG